MKIRTVAATAAFTLAALAATTPSAQAELPIGNKSASVAEMHRNVITEMSGSKAFGWQLAIAKDGEVVVTDSRGTAISEADNSGTAVAMKPWMKMELASVTKNITAVATMKLLRMHGLTVESFVAPYLPDDWTLGAGFEDVRFRHLLTHTSGINQALSAMANPPKNNGWDAMKTIVANGTQVDSQRQYKNANFALLRIIDAELWLEKSGYVDTITKENHTAFMLDFDRKKIFQPIGLYGVGCIAPGTTTGVHSYPVNATQATVGKVLGTGSSECAGARGIALSSIQLVKYLAALRHGSIINPADLDTMDELRAGWNEDSNGGDGGENGVQDGIADNPKSPGAYWHGGDLIGDNQPQLHTCVMTFDDGIEATLLVNSPLVGTTQCGVLLRSWYAAK